MVIISFMIKKHENTSLSEVANSRYKQFVRTRVKIIYNLEHF